MTVGRCVFTLCLYFNADIRELSICYGPNWEPTWAWLNLRLDDIRRASSDPSMPPLGWWDRVRLNYHGRLAFACHRMSWAYPTSLDPYNANEFLTCQWTRSTFDWTPGNSFFIYSSFIDRLCSAVAKRFPIRVAVGLLQQ